MVKTIVLKFGGAAVATTDRFGLIADRILERCMHYQRVVVVVSAMGNTTDELLVLARRVHPSPPKREQDMLISVGERISMALLAMALDLKGRQAVSLTGSQAGLITSSTHADARIIDVKPQRLLRHLDQEKVVIVAGFQGVSRAGEITTLGRGGSDTTAVALAIALRAEKVEFYKDVSGIYSEDPKKNPAAQLYSVLDYKKAVELTRQGARILQSRCIDLAAKNRLPLHVLPFAGPKESSGTWIREESQTAFSDLIYEQE